jgi:hypothetical protein
MILEVNKSTLARARAKPPLGMSKLRLEASIVAAAAAAVDATAVAPLPDM